MAYSAVPFGLGRGVSKGYARYLVPTSATSLPRIAEPPRERRCQFDSVASLGLLRSLLGLMARPYPVLSLVIE
jgi:hypothetical protein